MKASSFEKLLVGGRWMRSRFVPGALILLYHRVAEPNVWSENDGTLQDPFALCVSPQHFEEHLALLRRRAHPMPLAALMAAAQENSLPPRAVAVTFDDGYLDNLQVAKPMLERFETPATVFVATGYAGQPFWWDRLVHSLQSPERLPDQLHLVVNGRSHHWRLRMGASETRRQLLRSLYRLLRPLAPGNRDALLIQIAQWAGAVLGANPMSRALTAKEVLQLATGGLVTVGAHSVTHPLLSGQPLDRQRWEILESKRYLEEITGQSITGFAYPYGLPADYDTDSVRLVQETGFAYACANHVDIVWRGSDPYQLPRFWVRDWPAQEFQDRLRRWLLL